MGKLTKISPGIQGDWREILDSFILFKRAEGVCDRTIWDYEYLISRFFDQFPEIQNYDQLKKNVLRYFANLSGSAPATHNLRRKNLNTFFYWCVSEGIISENPIKHIKIKKDEGRIRPIPKEDLQKLIALPNQKVYVGFRDYSMILLSLDCGIRPSEAVFLTDRHINTRAGEVFVSADIAKTGISRTLPISRETSVILSRLIGINQKTWGLSWVFCSCEGVRLTVHAWQERMQVYSKKLKTTISPYDLRHAFAILYLKNKGDLFSLQRIMGHTDIEMTKRYIAFSQTDIHVAHAGASPLATLLNKKKKIVKINK